MQRETLRLELRGITKRFPGTTALDHVDFDLRGGEIHALVGENGAGKSTLIKILSGIYRKDSGKILLNGRAVELNSPHDAELLGISVVYQDMTLVPALTGLQNIFLGHEITDAFGQPRWEEMRRQAGRLLGELGVATNLDVPVGELSRSDQQIIMIARALSRRMRILILDEVTGAIPRDEEERLFEVMRRLQAQEQVAIIYITHRLEEIIGLANRVTVLTNGRKVATFLNGDYTMEGLIAAMIGERGRRTETRPEQVLGDIALRVTHLAGGNVKDVTFTLRRGEIVGLTGLLGCGKETLAQILFGITPRRAGRIEVFGKPVDIQHPLDAIRHGMFLVPEDRQIQGLIHRMSVQENLTLSRLRRVTGPLGLIYPRKERSLARRYVDELGIVLAGLGRPVSTLSGGNQQRLVIGKGLFTESNIYVFVNPTRGVDVGARQEIYHLIRRLAAEREAAVLVISSEIPEVQSVSHRILVMRAGLLSAELPSAQVPQAEILTHFYASGRNHGKEVCVEA